MNSRLRRSGRLAHVYRSTLAALLVVAASSGAKGISKPTVPVSSPNASTAKSRTEPADLLLDRAKKIAAVDHKLVLLKFGASWCGPCRLWGAVLADPKVQPIIERNFTVLDLDPAENPDEKLKENPGAAALMMILGAEEITLPFLAVVTSAGKKVFDSNMPLEGKAEENMGYPFTPRKTAWFLGRLHAVAPSITQAQLETIRISLIEHKSQK